jgi:hypothetical protein
VFTDPETYKRLVGCHVLDDMAVTELSDHASVGVIRCRRSGAPG